MMALLDGRKTGTEARSFLKKRTEKLLSTRIGRASSNRKFFASFFQKRRPSSFPLSALGRQYSLLNMPRFGLGLAGTLFPAKGDRANAAKRLAHAAPDDQAA